MTTPGRSSDHSPDPRRDHLQGVADKIADGLLARTLPKPRWTHEGHVLACVSLVRRHGAPEALAILRAAIPPYNESTGVANTPTSGYHDTITVYYVWAVDQLLAAGVAPADILHHPLVGRDAPLAWWDRETLMSPAARARFVGPTRNGAGSGGPTEFLQPEMVDC